MITFAEDGFLYCTFALNYFEVAWRRNNMQAKSLFISVAFWASAIKEASLMSA
jgi:hypothetical protein